MPELLKENWWRFVIGWLVIVQVINAFTEDSSKPVGFGMSAEDDYRWEIDRDE